MQFKWANPEKTAIHLETAPNCWSRYYAGSDEWDKYAPQLADYVPPAPAWADIRSKRNGLLAETDWVVVKAQETGEAVPAAWATYRQALRDLPANTADPANPVWPTKP